MCNYIKLLIFVTTICCQNIVGLTDRMSSNEPWPGSYFPASSESNEHDYKLAAPPVNALNLGLNTGTVGSMISQLFGGKTESEVPNWSGNWFPNKPGGVDTNPTKDFNKYLADPNHGIVMGIEDPSCDDGKRNLAQDWYLDPTNFTCLEDKHLYRPRSTIHPIHTAENIPRHYSAMHKCMNEKIDYNEIIPTFGTHRPLWAIYGEYTFLPRQRWLHNLEHGALVMLYHPCAEKNQVKLLKSIVTSCLYRHIITPYNLLSTERPFALVTWGHRLEMSKVAPDLAIDFIKQHALKGPEKLSKNGQYTLMLEKKSEVVTNIDDSIICPNYNTEIHMK